MLDPTIPLTITEWEEWGNPAEAEYYQYMKSYSPVDNIQKADYPNILVTAGGILGASLSRENRNTMHSLSWL
jgi:oligopeptidase B